MKVEPQALSRARAVQWCANLPAGSLFAETVWSIVDAFEAERAAAAAPPERSLGSQLHHFKELT